MMSFTDYVKTADMPRYHYFVKKHNLRYLSNPMQLSHKTSVNIEGTVDNVNAFAADIAELDASAAQFEKELQDSKSPWIKFKKWISK